MTLLKASNIQYQDILHDIDLSIGAGERLGLIGESGSGKTLTALALMRLIDAQGEVQLHDQDLHALSESALCKVRGKKIAMVFQEPMTALDPLMRVDKQLVQAQTLHGVSRSVAHARVPEMLQEVELDSSFATRYPHELSGGQRQRVLIAMALANDPDVLICDEPTTALDVTSQQAIVNLIIQLTQQHNAGLIFITHDLGLIAQTCERVLVLQKGHIVERGSVTEVLQNPQHEYTKSLIDAANLPAARAHIPSEEVLVELAGVHKTFTRRRTRTTAVQPLDLRVTRGQRLGIVGGSGSGKTTLLKMIAGFTQPSGGTISTHGATRMVFQDPLSSLDPRMTIRQILQEAGTAVLSEDELTRALSEVGLSEEMLDRYPHEFSGGQRQRISIARALLGHPDVLLADEPVSALDVSVRKKVLALLDSLVAEHNLTMIFVSHDLQVVRSVCTEVLVMQQGEVVESGPVEEVFNNPQHPYTQQLLAAIPMLHRA